jgi:hypothetical protein
VRSSISIQGLSSSQIKDNLDVAYAIREELAKAAGVDTSLITLTEYCDAGGCVSLTAARRRLIGIATMGTALSGFGGERRQSQGSINFEIAAPTASADAVVNAIKDSAVTEKLAQGIKTSMAKKGIAVTASVSTSATTVEDSSSEDNPYKGWVYNMDEATGVYHLVNCPDGRLVVNDTIQKQTCAACPANSYSVNPQDDCGSSYSPESQPVWCRPRACEGQVSRSRRLRALSCGHLFPRKCIIFPVADDFGFGCRSRQGL